ARIVQAVGEVQDAALAEQDVVVEVLGQRFPQLHGVLVNRGALIPQVVGANDRGVAGHVAPGEPAAFKNGDIGDSVVASQVVGGGEAVPAPAHDHDVVRAFGVRVAPEVIGVLRTAHASFS